MDQRDGGGRGGGGGREKGGRRRERKYGMRNEVRERMEEVWSRKSTEALGWFADRNGNALYVCVFIYLV